MADRRHGYRASAGKQANPSPPHRGRGRAAGAWAAVGVLALFRRSGTRARRFFVVGHEWPTYGMATGHRRGNGQTPALPHRGRGQRGGGAGGGWCFGIVSQFLLSAMNGRPTAWLQGIGGETGKPHPTPPQPSPTGGGGGAAGRGRRRVYPPRSFCRAALMSFSFLPL